MNNNTKIRRPYVKARLERGGNIKAITFSAPSWQVSCTTDNHGPHGNGHGHGHEKAHGRGHHR